MQLFQGHKDENRLIISLANEIKHCVQVTRHRIGEVALITDFKGSIWKGTIKTIDNTFIELSFIDVYSQEPESAKLTLAVSLTQNNDRFEWFLEKATETGIDKVIPMITDRTENRKDKRERWEKIIYASAKQCLRARLPILDPITSFNNVLKTTSTEQRYICHCENTNLLFLGKAYEPSKDCLILIGPEGDFSAQEIEQARLGGFVEVSLGQERLRVETAAIAASMITNTIKNIQ
ncbi:MAG: RsmE family RNA methyltransferase [Saprospiraceae bacterium]